MKTQRISWLMLLLLLTLGLVLPAAAQDAAGDAAGEPPIEEDSVLGTWYAQLMDGEIPPEGASLRIVFEEDGTGQVFENDEHEETFRFLLDERAGTVTILDLDNGEVEVTLKYSFLDDMLIFRFTEGGREEQVMELTRNPEGTERHQRMRAEMAGQPNRHSRMQSMTQMRGMHQGLVTAANGNKNIMPASLGHLIIGEYITPEYLLAPWSDEEVPEGFDDWDDQRKIDWGNTHTDYVFVLGDQKVQMDAEKVALFELPAGEDAETVAVLFEDNHTETMAFDEADALIKQQTGHSIAQWMKTTTPGAGEMVQPEEDEENAARDAADDAGTE